MTWKVNIFSFLLQTIKIKNSHINKRISLKFYFDRGKYTTLEHEENHVTILY